jgi:hypothetical protein
MTRYAVVNQSTAVSDNDAYTMWHATKDQLYYHVAPAWERKFVDSIFIDSVTLLKSGVPAGVFPIYLLDNPDVANALGYHTEDPGGKIYGRVFAEPVLQNGGSALAGSLSISSVLSHEIMEFFVDKHCQLWADRGDGTMVAYEVGDPVESDSYTVHTTNKQGVKVPVSVSNFVLDAWFDVQATAPGTRYDWMKKVTAPLQMTTGGYGVILNVGTGQVSQIFGSRDHEARHGAIKPFHVSSRTVRRVAANASALCHHGVSAAT